MFSLGCFVGLFVCLSVNKTRKSINQLVEYVGFWGYLDPDIGYFSLSLALQGPTCNVNNIIVMEAVNWKSVLYDWLKMRSHCS